MIGWERVLKEGKGFDIIIGKEENFLENNERGFALRLFYKDKISFISSTNQFDTLSKNFILKEEKLNLPQTKGNFEAEKVHEINKTEFLNSFDNFKREIFLNVKRDMEICKINFSYSYFFLKIENSSGAEVSLKNSNFYGSISIKGKNFYIELPFLSNYKLEIPLKGYLNAIEPYFYMPLPLKTLETSRKPAIIFPYVLSYIFESLMDNFLKGEIPELPPGFYLKDLPHHPLSPNYFPIDGEGREKKEFELKKGNFPLDTFKGYILGRESTSNSLRNSIFEPPEVGFHNLVLKGPEKDLDNFDSFVSLTYPLYFFEKDTNYYLNSEGFLYEKGKPKFFLPEIFIKFTLKDFFSSFSFVKKPLLFYSFSNSFGLPFLFLKGLNFFSSF